MFTLYFLCYIYFVLAFALCLHYLCAFVFAIYLHMYLYITYISIVFLFALCFIYALLCACLYELICLYFLCALVYNLLYACILFNLLILAQALLLVFIGMKNSLIPRLGEKLLGHIKIDGQCY